MIPLDFLFKNTLNISLHAKPEFGNKVKDDNIRMLKGYDLRI